MKYMKKNIKNEEYPERSSIPWKDVELAKKDKVFITCGCLGGLIVVLAVIGAVIFALYLFFSFGESFDKYH